MNVSSMKRVHNNEQGLVAIMVTIIIMIVISLIVIGFAKITQRDARQTLDRQLSTQAFYAAETGINDATVRIYNGKLTTKINDCSGVKNFPNGGVIDSTAQVAYTCLLVDTNPTSIEFSRGIGQGRSAFFPIYATSSINTINFSWESPTGGADFSGCPTSDKLPPISSPAGGAWDSTRCQAGVLRVDLVPINSGTLGRDQLMANQMTALFYPASSGGNTVNYTSGFTQTGGIVATNCTTAASTRYQCNMKVTGLNATGYMLRIRPIYEDAVLSVTAQNSANANTDLELSGAQVLVDATGKAQDILRRVQVRVPIYNIYTPEAAVQVTDGVCKILSVVRDGALLPGTATNGPNEPICQSSLPSSTAGN